MFHLSCIQLFAAPWTVVHQAPVSMKFHQARILEWVAISLLQGIFLTQGWTRVSCIAHRFFTVWAHQRAHGAHGQWKVTWWVFKMLQLDETCILPGCYLGRSSKHTLLWTPLDFVFSAASSSLLQHDNDGHSGLAMKMMDIQGNDTVPWPPGEEALKGYLLSLVFSCSWDLGERWEILDITCSNSIILQMRTLCWGRGSSPGSQMDRWKDWE